MIKTDDFFENRGNFLYCVKAYEDGSIDYQNVDVDEEGNCEPVGEVYRMTAQDAKHSKAC